MAMCDDKFARLYNEVQYVDGEKLFWHNSEVFGDLKTELEYVKARLEICLNDNIYIG